MAKYICEVCGKNFSDRPSHKRRFCSEKCWYSTNELKVMGERVGRSGKGHRFQSGVSFSEETRQKMSLAKKGKPLSEAHKGALSRALKGKKNSGQFQKGQVPWDKGRARPEITGAKHPRWKGGEYITPAGYRLISCPYYSKVYGNNYYLEHRLVMEEALSRQLDSREVVHHINGDRHNNCLENLALMSREEHGRLHRQEWLNKENA